LIVLLAQTADVADGISYGLLLTTLGVEGTLAGLSWTAFNAEARSEKDRDSDIRDAMAGYDSGKVVPAVAQLIETVLAVRRPDEPIQNALDRADTSGPLKEVVAAATVLGSPREIEERLLKTWTSVGASTVGVQLSGPVVLFNEIFDSGLVSHTGLWGGRGAAVRPECHNTRQRNGGSVPLTPVGGALLLLQLEHDVVLRGVASLPVHQCSKS